MTYTWAMSAEDFQTLVWPTHYEMRFGRLIPVEQLTNSIASMLDRNSGIDYFVKRPDDRMFSLAARCQLIAKSYDTFTIRIKAKAGNPTEIHKRQAQLVDPMVMGPQWTCQAYISLDRGHCIAAAMAKTEDILRAYALKGHWKHDNGDGTAMTVVAWSEVPSAIIRRYDPRQPTLWDSLQMEALCD